MEKLREKLQRLKRLEIVGSGGSEFIALDVQHKFLKIGIKCHANPDSHSQEAMSASLEVRRCNYGDFPFRFKDW